MCSFNFGGIPVHSIYWFTDYCTCAGLCSVVDLDCSKLFRLALWFEEAIQWSLANPNSWNSDTLQARSKHFSVGQARKWV